MGCADRDPTVIAETIVAVRIVVRTSESSIQPAATSRPKTVMGTLSP